MSVRRPYGPLPLPEGVTLDRVRSIRFDAARNRIVIVSEGEGCTSKIRVDAREDAK